jgi:3',5'-cyclic AMP phosphodiesterase CpdA
VIITGDLTNRAGDADQISEFHRIARKIDPGIKVYNVAGNHDVKNEPTAESLAQYRKNWGPDYYSFDSGDLRGIVLNSSLIQAPVNVQSEADKQEQWLKAQLAKARTDGKRVVIFQHIPFFLKTGDEPDQYFNVPKQTRARYLAMFHEYGVRHIYAGHYHRNAEGHDGDLSMVTTGPIGMPIGPDPSGFRVVTMDKLEHPYISLANIPNQVTAKTATGGK